MGSSDKWFHHRYQALYNYIPRNEDELELREGDVVDVMEKCDDGWFVGKIVNNNTRFTLDFSVQNQKHFPKTYWTFFFKYSSWREDISLHPNS